MPIFFTVLFLSRFFSRGGPLVFRFAAFFSLFGLAILKKELKFNAQVHLPPPAHSCRDMKYACGFGVHDGQPTPAIPIH